jgi:hypothetical protein
MQYCEIAFSSFIILYLTISLIAGANENNCGDFKTWLKGSMGFYIADLILSLN